MEEGLTTIEVPAHASVTCNLEYHPVKKKWRATITTLDIETQKIVDKASSPEFDTKEEAMAEGRKCEQNLRKQMLDQGFKIQEVN